MIQHGPHVTKASCICGVTANQQLSNTWQIVEDENRCPKFPTGPSCKISRREHNIIQCHPIWSVPVCSMYTLSRHWSYIVSCINQHGNLRVSTQCNLFHKIRPFFGIIKGQSWLITLLGGSLRFPWNKPFTSSVDCRGEDTEPEPSVSKAVRPGSCSQMSNCGAPASRNKKSARLQQKVGPCLDVPFGS